MIPQISSEEPKQIEAPAIKKKWQNSLVSALVVILLVTWGYIIWNKSKTKEKIAQKDTAVSATLTQKEELQNELEDATMRYDMIKTASVTMEHSKDSVILARDREISEKRIKIKQLLSKVGVTGEELSQAKALIISLNENIESYKSQIEVLEQQKVALQQEKELIANQRDKIAKDYESAKKLVKEKESIIDIGSTLHASNFSIRGINEKKGGKEIETAVAKRVDKLRISFDLDENRIAQSGEKEIYICIQAPDGTLVASETLGSGIFSTRDGVRKVYTQKITVNYMQGKRQTISYDWRQNGNFIIGDYKIEVYNNGYKIGDAICSLKKGGLFS